MTNPLTKISRLFRKNPTNDFLAQLHSKLSQPLFVHPQLGKTLIDSYLRMGNSTYDMSASDDGNGTSVDVIIQGSLAVMDISGSLVDREMSTPCARSPVSYEAIKLEMSDLLVNSEVTTIIARLNTPGGTASQNMDLSDFIYNSRGKGTKLIAVVDDMAYSAGFSIASAFDQIWISRTGGVGSVGVVSYHEDHSKYLEKQGIKVEYIYAGDKKVFGNATEPLSKEARAEFQTEVIRLYDIFTETVARNLNMSVTDVRATQAGTFHGKNAIEAGFAHKLGTFDDVLQSLFEEEQTLDKKDINMLGNELKTDQEEGTGADPALENSPKAVVEDTENPVDLAEAEVDEQEAKANAYKASIEALCMVAGVEASATAKFIEAKMSAEDVSDHLMKLTANPTAEVSNTEKSPLAVDAKQEIKASWETALNTGKNSQ